MADTSPLPLRKVCAHGKIEVLLRDACASNGKGSQQSPHRLVSPMIERELSQAAEHYRKLGAETVFYHSKKVIAKAGEAKLVDLRADETDQFSLEMVRMLAYHPLVSESYLPPKAPLSEKFLTRFELHRRLKALDSTPEGGLHGHVKLLNDTRYDSADLLAAFYARMADMLVVDDPATIHAATTKMPGIFPIHHDWQEVKAAWADPMLRIYCTIADWGGLTDAYRGMRDNAMFYLHPGEFAKVAELFNKTREAAIRTNNVVRGIIQKMSERLNLRVIIAHDSRTASKAFDEIGPGTILIIVRDDKGPGGALHKLHSRGVSPDSIHDRVAFKVITATTEQAYDVVSFLYGEGIRSVTAEVGSPHVHIEDLKDYIANPKPVTLYRGLHVDTVISDKNLVNFEAIVSTLDMHKWADEGGASHEGYKKSPLVNGERARFNAALKRIESAA